MKRVAGFTRRVAVWLLRRVAATDAVVEVTAEDRRYRFRATTAQERWRAETLLTKEAGTVAWIRDAVSPGEVFYDVGANIGLYSLLAAHRVGPTGSVYAFEPHAANFLSLLHNIDLNGLSGIVHPLAVALHNKEGLFPFNYRNWTAGSSKSQLDSTKDGDEKEFRPILAELKFSAPLDVLVERQYLRPPDHVKIDVDGNELFVLEGMRRLLQTHPPRTLQVEINTRYNSRLLQFLADSGYVQYARHDTERGQSLIREGRNPDNVAHNALFRPAEGRMPSV